MKSKANYYSILLSIVINNFGDVLFDLFIVWRITRETESIMSAVYLIGSSILFRAVLSVFVGFIVDRFNKKRMIIFSCISSACIISVFALLYEFIKVNIVFGVIIILLNDINNEVFSRGTMLLSAELFDKEVFIKFQAKYSVINRIVVIAGSSIVGFMMTIIPDALVFVIDILTFIISSMLILFVSYEYTASTKLKKTIGGELRRIRDDVKCMAKEMRTNKFIIKFIIIMFILNIAYGYIPYILPVKIANDSANPTLLGVIKSSIAIGEVIGLSAVSIFGDKVSLLFKTSMIGNSIVIAILCFSQATIIVVICFLLYGALDSITQPLFGYTVSIIDEENRGKVLGGIDAIILLSPSVGMYIVTRLMDISSLAGHAMLILVFLIAFLIIRLSGELNGIDLKKV